MEPEHYKFSIVVITFNRGKTALKMVKEVLPQIDSDWELLVLNNDSVTEVDAYAEIAEMAQTHSNLNYIHHPTNLDFAGNYAAAFEYGKSTHMILMSDEDFPNVEAVKKVIPYVVKKKNLGIYRGGIEPTPGTPPANSITLEDKYMKGGEKAMLGYGFMNNYFSGTIYNRKLILEAGIIDKLKSSLYKNRIYPHLYIDMLSCALFDARISSKTMCFEGPVKAVHTGDGRTLEEYGGHFYSEPYSFGSRIDQFVTFRDSIIEAIRLKKKDDFDYNLFIKLYLNLCAKYMRLVSRVNSPMYTQHFINIDDSNEAMKQFCLAAVMAYPELESARADITNALETIKIEYSKQKSPVEKS